jgi:hypothetical protein
LRRPIQSLTTPEKTLVMAVAASAIPFDEPHDHH